jgi:hypothetical protein
MSAAKRLGAFAAGLAVLFGAATAVGAAVGPEPAKAAAEAPPPEGQGVVAAKGGYRLVPLSRTLSPGGGAFEFRIDNPDGGVTRRFTPLHERLLHLIVVSRDLTDYNHVHPTLGTDGVWSVDLPARAPGSYRAIADFEVTGGPHLALGTDLAVTGEYQPGVLDDPAPTTTVDGYHLSLAAEGGQGGAVTFTINVTKDGHPVRDLENYLGAKGHLVAIRVGDLAYAHVHPITDAELEPGTVVFDSTLDASGRYGLFFDFQHGGVVRTARFTFDQGLVKGAPTMEH